MTANWSTAHQLDVIDRLFKHYYACAADQQLLSIHWVLNALQQEPAIAVHLRDIRETYRLALQTWHQEWDATAKKLTDWKNANPDKVGGLTDPEKAKAQLEAWVFPQPMTWAERKAELKKLLGRVKLANKHGPSITTLLSEHNLALSQFDCGLALVRLELVAKQVCAPPKYGAYSTHKDELWIGKLFADGWDAANNDFQVAQKATQVLADMKILHTEIALRVGRAASRRHLVDRYAKRCKMFHSERLRNLADKNKGKPEAVLVLDFAEFLFDAGLNPILNSEISGLKPDVTDLAQPDGFYAEAKQYKTWSKAQLLDAFAQVWSTWHTLPNIAEAFLVIFRRSDSMFLLPPSISANGKTMHLHLIDIATNKSRGSKAPKKPIEITEADLMNVTTELPPNRKRKGKTKAAKKR